MKNGIIIGAIIGIFLYMIMPIYSVQGEKASLLPTGNVVNDQSALARYVDAFPFSMMTFLILEVIGIGFGIIAEMYLKKPKEN